MKPRNEGSAPTFEYVARRQRRVNVDHGPDNLDFTKTFKRDCLLMLIIAVVSFVGISLTLYYSVNGGW